MPLNPHSSLAQQQLPSAADRHMRCPALPSLPAAHLGAMLSV